MVIKSSYAFEISCLYFIIYGYVHSGTVRLAYVAGSRALINRVKDADMVGSNICRYCFHCKATTSVGQYFDFHLLESIRKSISGITWTQMISC